MQRAVGVRVQAMALLFAHGAKVSALDRWGHSAVDEGRVASGASEALVAELSRRAVREAQFGTAAAAPQRCEAQGAGDDSAREGDAFRDDPGGDGAWHAGGEGGKLAHSGVAFTRSLSRLASMRRHHSDANLAERGGEASAPPGVGGGLSPFAAAAAAAGASGEDNALASCDSGAGSLRGAGSSGSGDGGAIAVAGAKARRREEVMRLLPEVPERSGELSGDFLSPRGRSRSRSQDREREGGVSGEGRTAPWK